MTRELKKCMTRTLTFAQAQLDMLNLGVVTGTIWCGHGVSSNQHTFELVDDGESVSELLS